MSDSPKPYKPTAAVDFDGVLHWYRRGWQDGSIYDVPAPGAQRGIDFLREHGFRVVIYTTRTPAEDVQAWLVKHGFGELEVSNHKPPAIAYIDDRAVPFVGDWDQAVAGACDLRECGTWTRRQEAGS